MTPSQRAAVAVEHASFNQLGGDRKTKQNFRVEFSTLNEVAEINGIDRRMIAWAKKVWDAAETSSDQCLHSAIKPAASFGKPYNRPVKAFSNCFSTGLALISP